ncbi:GIY-YIG nuclease family protein [Vibrio vulnificus]|uniref:GIY-YIG nuclease family protein n=1 Tax=Vibrio vulnificus TaxID=672 RepID=UPI0024DF3FEC|nr:GIY-YIG nuclease family protein [Vibrio vulnificus]MDK2618103.1 GIY-YIG nuclease family protein [Vibrio vulnificus]MDK2675053.1 GIY-YIG nuclease family protein [Vibrio vulnificus]
MDNGYVYILINASMPDLLKIGMTARDSRQRARELSNTSVPTPYKVAFEIFSCECGRLESQIHKELSEFRVNPNREFFRYPLDKAIAILQNLSSNASQFHENYEAVEIIDDLVHEYPGCLKEDIVSVRIVQPGNRVWLEITTEKVSRDGELVDQVIRRDDLAFIIDEEDDLYFRPEDHIQVNAHKFVKEFGPFSIYMVTDLFNDKAGKQINKEHNPRNGKKSS